MDSNRLNISRRIILFGVFLGVLTFPSSAQNMKSLTNEMVNSESAEVNNRKLKEVEIKELIKLLSNLKEYKKEVYSKPDYVVTYTKDGSMNFISVFKKEHFVYIGDYLDAWGTRMHGEASSGYKLSKKLLKYLSGLD